MSVVLISTRLGGFVNIYADLRAVYGPGLPLGGVLALRKRQKTCDISNKSGSTKQETGTPGPSG
eukprot:7922918-Pyramimonas_sp.AAC.1